MYKDLSSGVKISITRSISTSFEAYLARIGWDEDKFSMEDFVQEWQTYFRESAAWIDKVPQEVLLSEEFHAEIAKKMDEVIAKTSSLQKQLGTSYSYECKAEAAYVEQLLKQQLKK